MRDSVKNLLLIGIYICSYLATEFVCPPNKMADVTVKSPISHVIQSTEILQSKRVCGIMHLYTILVREMLQSLERFVSSID